MKTFDHATAMRVAILYGNYREAVGRADRKDGSTLRRVIQECDALNEAQKETGFIVIPLQTVETIANVARDWMGDE